MGRSARSSLDGELAANARRLFISGDVVRGFLDGATAAEVRAANRLLSAELESRDVHRRERLMRRARFPQVKSFEGYDYSQVAFPDGHGPADLGLLAFLDAAEGFVFHGRTGRGKTHLATAMGVRAVSMGRPVRFHSTARLVMQLERARADGKLDGALRDATNADLVILTSSATSRSTSPVRGCCSRWCRTATRGGASSSRPTSSSGGGARSSATTSSPRR